MTKSVSRRQFINIAGASSAVLGLGMLAGCNSSNQENDAEPTAGNVEADGTFAIATDTTFAPFEFTDANGDFVGIDVDILAAIAENQGFAYDLNPLGFDAAVAALESGQADGVIAGMSITDERKEKFDFSDPYYESYVCAAAKDGGDVKSLEDLSGKTVACKTGTQSAMWAEAIAADYGFEIAYFDTSDMMYQDVQTGNTAACFEDFPVMAYGVTQGNGLTIIGEDSEDFATPYGFAVRKGDNPDLLEKFNAGLAAIKSDGTYDEICAKYLEA